MNMMVMSVSSLIKHIIDKILIPRIEKEGNKYSSDSISRYIELSGDKDRMYQLAKLTVSGIKERLYYLKNEDLEDFLSNVISSTIQGESNGYQKFMKSRNGFWTGTFNVFSDRGFSDFGRTFSYFLFKAVQGETRKLKYRFKHEVSVIDDSDKNISLVNEMEDERDDNRSYYNFSQFEKGVEKIKKFAETTKEFDDLDRKIFFAWLKEKDNGNFTENVNVSKTVYAPIISELKLSGKKITPAALHFRWKRIRLFLKEEIFNN